MNVSRPSVHPVEAPPLTDLAAQNALRVRMKDVQGMPGTAGGLVLRLCQLGFAAISLSVMATTSDFPSVTAFCYLVAAVSVQCVWSLSLAIVDVYALLVRRSLRNCKVVGFFTIGDGLESENLCMRSTLSRPSPSPAYRNVGALFMQITSTLTFAAACASAGITVLIANDLNKCDVNHCKRFETATAMAFISWFAVSPSFLLNFWSLASR
ncbi:unnamed protein product [Prunus armeniaca]|uniref:CASP-like protein n=1 Tax=Prunus armeniaca TaxID=36596 RepID=A0A6J5XU34_PRUAR|nr:unnamed protein product [Prunus armeniaca]CAB4314678.1 unnamed protein product [Prunus armeniaca]